MVTMVIVDGYQAMVTIDGYHGSHANNTTPNFHCFPNFIGQLGHNLSCNFMAMHCKPPLYAAGMNQRPL